VLNIFPKGDTAGISGEDLFWLGMQAGAIARSVLDNQCLLASTATRQLALRCRTDEDYANALAHHVCAFVGCEACTILLVNPAGDRLLVRGTTGIDWGETPEHERHYIRGEGLTGRVWDSEKPMLTEDTRLEEGSAAKSQERVTTEQYTSLIAPVIASNGEVLGVIRCRNKNLDLLGGFNVFTDDDLAVVSAILERAAEGLQFLRAEADRAQLLEQARHERSWPVYYIKSMAAHARRRIGRLDFDVKPVLEGILATSELLIWLQETEEAPLREEEGMTIVDLIGDIVKPCVEVVQALLIRRGWSQHASQIEILPSDLPEVRLRRLPFRRVVFNLLSNAIRYADSEGGAFRVRVETKQKDRGFLLTMEDWGCGVSEGWPESIFLRVNELRKAGGFKWRGWV
jgi:GAF domain-containing protein